MKENTNRNIPSFVRTDPVDMHVMLFWKAASRNDVQNCMKHILDICIECWCWCTCTRRRYAVRQYDMIALSPFMNDSEEERKRSCRVPARSPIFNGFTCRTANILWKLNGGFYRLRCNDGSNTRKLHPLPFAAPVQCNAYLGIFVTFCIKQVSPCTRRILRQVNAHAERMSLNKNYYWIPKNTQHLRRLTYTHTPITEFGCSESTSRCSNHRSRTAERIKGGTSSTISTIK